MPPQEISKKDINDKHLKVQLNWYKSIQTRFEKLAIKRELEQI